MTVSNSWRVRNKLYQLKEREKGLEKCVEDTKDDYTFLKEFKLFKRPKNAVFYKWYASVCLFAILGLDKIIYYHWSYLGFPCNRCYDISKSVWKRPPAR